MKMKKITLWKTISGVLFVLLVISFYTGGFKDVSTPSVSTGTGELSIVVLSDERCDTCDTSGLITQLSTVFPDAEFVELDYNDNEGKGVYDEAGVQLLPAVLLTDAVKEHESYSQVEQYLTEAGDYLSLRVGASFDPTAEICDNEVDDNADGKTDCDDEDCSLKLVCNADALIECVEPSGISADTVIFYYSTSCPWCQKMVPGVENLEKEDYDFYWANTGVAEEVGIVQECFGDYLGGGVPQFICVKNGEIHTGAFTDENRELDQDALQKFADDCIAG